MSARHRVEQLVSEYADLIKRLSYTYLGSTVDAEDVCQEVLLKLIGRAKSFESSEHERAWVVRVTANCCKDLLRRCAVRHTLSLDEAPEPVAQDLGDDRTRAELVLHAVMRLPLEYREAIFLRYYENYSIRDVARACSCGEDAAAQRLSRGRAKLKALLKEAGYDEEDL